MAHIYDLYDPLSIIAIPDHPFAWGSALRASSDLLQLSNVAKHVQIKKHSGSNIPYTQISAVYTSILECQNVRLNAVEYVHAHHVCIRCYKTKAQNDLEIQYQ